MKFKDGIKEKHVIVKCGADKFLPFALVFGFYIILFGTVSPGGGFQGGVTCAAAVLLIYLGHGYRAVVKALKPDVMRTNEAIGATIYVLFAFSGIAVGAYFCRNWFYNIGAIGDLVSAGTITFMGWSVGFKVLSGMGFLLMLMLGMLLPEDEIEEEKEDAEK